MACNCACDIRVAYMAKGFPQAHYGQSDQLLLRAGAGLRKETAEGAPTSMKTKSGGSCQ
ncbi:hypothetical protein WUBG_04008, partial [Wuchereria bancrofti]